MNNLIIILIINFCSLLASEQVTEVAMTGWSAGIGVWAQILGGVFTLLAMITTYWSLSLALSDIVTETIHTERRLSWLIATLPSLLIALVNPVGFLGIMRLGGGLISIIIAVMVVPAYINSRKDGTETILRNRSKWVWAVVIAAYILMGIGSMVPID